MANSRLEKIGTIYTRARGLIQSGAMRWEDRPLWFDLFEAFPPKEEPKFDRPAPNIPLKKIFYEEDTIRAMFHKENKQTGVVNLSNSTSPTLTQKFIECYQKLQKEYDEFTSPEKIYEEAIEILQKEREKILSPENESEIVSLTKSFKDAKDSEKNLKIKVDELFKES